MKVFGDHLLVGTYESLWNPDRIRYGGYNVFPKEFFKIKDLDQRRAVITSWRAKMADRPFTEEEKRQKEEWDAICMPEPDESMDDDVADAVIAWSQGYGEYPGGKGHKDNTHSSTGRHLQTIFPTNHQDSETQMNDEMDAQNVKGKT